jgi:hypothetical protein
MTCERLSEVSGRFLSLFLFCYEGSGDLKQCPHEAASPAAGGRSSTEVNFGKKKTCINNKGAAKQIAQKASLSIAGMSFTRLSETVAQD